MTPGEGAPTIKTPEQLTLEAKIPEVLIGFKYLIQTNPKSEEDQLAYEEKLLKVMAFPTEAFIFDNEHHTSVSKMFEDILVENNLIKQGDNLEVVFDNFHKKIVDLEMGR